MRTPTKKSTKKAAKTAKKRASKATGAATDRAAELAERAGVAAEKAGAVAAARAADLAELLRDSEALARAQERGSELTERFLDSDAVARAQERGGELAGLARSKWRDAEIEARAAELAERIRDSDAARQTSRKAKDLTDTGLSALGGWLVAGKGAEKLHLDDKLGIEKKHRVPGWLLALIGVAVGFAVAKLTAGQNGSSVRDDLSAAADRLANSAPNPATTVLADTVRTTLQGDPRTASLSQVNINVAEGTVFVRGRIPSGIDEQAIREVIEGVPGVEDVDLHLTPAS